MLMVTVAALMLQGAGPGPVVPAQIEDAKRALNAQLLDYPSARFRDVRGTEAALCGFVNAKNRVGAYSGWSRFVWLTVTDSHRLLIDDDEGTNDIMLDAFCGEDGLRNQGRDYSEQMTGSGS